MDNNDFDYHYNRSKRLYGQDRYEESLASLKKAYSIYPTEKLQIKINKLEDLVNSKSTEIKFKKDTNKILLNDKYYVDPISFNKLYKHQQTGVAWLFDLFEKRKGGILGDDMGLGKTVQAIFFLRELFESKLINTGLIVMPKSLLINWEREFRVWGPNLKVLTYFGNERERNLRKIKSRGGILITTYNTIVFSWADLNQHGDNKFDVIILDEGHKIKNSSSKTCKAINAIRSDFKLILTGTAMQNNLKELWVLFDFIHQGTLLGNYQTFRLEYEKPINDSRKKDATPSIKALGIQIAKSLKTLVSPYMLRRTKEQITENIPEEDLKKNFPKLPKKTELVLWVRLTEIQKICYQKFIQLDDVKALLTRSDKRSPLVELNILKKICDHPRLLPASYCEEMGMSFAKTIEDVENNLLLEESGKVSALWELLKRLMITEKEKDHKCLIFSQSKVVLKIIQKILYANRIAHLRLDGDIKTTVERQSLVDEFNKENGRARVMLLTSQVGGVGLTLTGADRVIICDLSWNPAVDAQAVDRVYRIGQRRDVLVYRLVTCGTLEEKIYRRQIFKDGLNRQATGVGKTDDDPCRHFTENDLVDLFKLEDPARSETQRQLAEYEESAIESIRKLSLEPDNDNHQSILKVKQKIEHTPDVIEELKFMKQRKSLVYDIGQHDLLFSEKDHGAKDLDYESQMSVKARAKEAEERLKMTVESRKNTYDSDLSNSMKSLSLSDSKWKSKFNNPTVPSVSGMKTLPELFIPSKADSKRMQLIAPRPNLGDARKQLLQQNINQITENRTEYPNKIENELTKENDKSSSDFGEENEKKMLHINDDVNQTEYPNKEVNESAEEDDQSSSDSGEENENSMICINDNVNQTEYSDEENESPEEDDQSSSDSGEENEKSMICINDSDVEQSSDNEEIIVSKKNSIEKAHVRKRLMEISDDSDSDHPKPILNRLRIDDSDDESEKVPSSKEHISLSDSDEPGFDDSGSIKGQESSNNQHQEGISDQSSVINIDKNDSCVNKDESQNAEKESEISDGYFIADESDVQENKLLSSENDASVPTDSKIGNDTYIINNESDIHEDEVKSAETDLEDADDSVLNESYVTAEESDDTEMHSEIHESLCKANEKSVFDNSATSVEDLNSDKMEIQKNRSTDKENVMPKEKLDSNFKSNVSYDDDIEEDDESILEESF